MEIIMLIHIVKYGQKVNTNEKNLWDKFFFINIQDYSINNTIIKCNRNIAIDLNNLDDLLSLIIQDPAKLERTYRYDIHGEFSSKELEKSFLNSLIYRNIPHNCHFNFLGIGINYNPNEISNIELRYQNRIINEEVVLNLHLDYEADKTLGQTVLAIHQAAVNFKGDIYHLNKLKAITLENFADRGYRVVQESKESYEQYTKQFNNQHPILKP